MTRRIARFPAIRFKQKNTLCSVNAIFHAPLYTGCKDDGRNYNKVGTNHPRRIRFWLPLIALFTGARINEICQLHTDDVQEKNGILFISINEED